MIVELPLLAALFAGGAATCLETETTVCLRDGRFAVSLSWDAEDARFGPATEATAGDAIPERFGNDTALLALANADRLDALVRVVDLCDLSDRYAVFAAIPSDVGYTLTVVDTFANVTRNYTGIDGELNVTVLDTFAFATCDTPPPARIGKAVDSKGSVTECGGGSNAICLNNNRYRLEVTGTQGEGTIDAFKTALDFRPSSAAAYFFDPDVIDLLLNVFPRPDDTFRFQSSGTTTIAYSIVLTDTTTGLTRTYDTPQSFFFPLLDGAPPELAVDAPASTSPGGSVTIEIGVFNPNSASADVDVTAMLSNELADFRWRCIPSGGGACETGFQTGPIDSALVIPGRQTATVIIEGTVPEDFVGSSITVSAEGTTAPTVLDEFGAFVTAQAEIDIVADRIFLSGFERDE